MSSTYCITLNRRSHQQCTLIAYEQPTARFRPPSANSVCRPALEGLMATVLVRRGANVPMVSTGASTGGVCMRCASLTARTHLTRGGLGRLRRPRPRPKMAMRVIAMEQDATTQPKLWVYLRRAELEWCEESLP